MLSRGNSFPKLDVPFENTLGLLEFIVFTTDDGRRTTDGFDLEVGSSMLERKGPPHKEAGSSTRIQGFPAKTCGMYDKGSSGKRMSYSAFLQIRLFPNKNHKK